MESGPGFAEHGESSSKERVWNGYLKALTKVDWLLRAFLRHGAGESAAWLRKSEADTAFLFNLKNVLNLW